MKGYNPYLLVLGLILCTVLSAANLSCQGGSTIPGNMEIHTYPPQNNNPESQNQLNNSAVLTQPDSSANNNDQTVVRNITVDERNNIFSIGIPAGYKENTSVSTAKPIDYWFEYLPAEAILEIDGNEIQRDAFGWQNKIAFTKSVTNFSYLIRNDTGNGISYNLHLAPSVGGASVTVTVRQRWYK